MRDVLAHLVSALAARSETLLIADLEAARRSMIELVAGLTEEDLDRRGRHPALGDAALDDSVKLVYRQTKIHLRDVSRC